jgi:hypothetical protein
MRMLLLVSALLASVISHWAADVPADVTAFSQAMNTLATQAETAKQSVVAGQNGFLFFVPELRSISVGPFWGEAAPKVSRALTPEAADPLPAILDFKAQLDKAGIELLVVPVPAKAHVYPERIAPAGTLSNTPPRLDAAQAAFIALLKAQGVPVLDLLPPFLGGRDDLKEGPFYCRQDSHWSGRACSLTARLIADAIKERPWLKAVPRRTLVTERQSLTITGDLQALLPEKPLPGESLPFTLVKEKSAEGLSFITPWRESPVLLLGDSHNLVFSVGDDMLVKGAGLPDHLAHTLGFPVDLVAVRGSGATPARVSLLRRRDNLAGKRLVIWCFTVREFTEGQGWKKVPVIRAEAK